MDSSVIETSNIIDEKASDLSFSQNINEIIGSIGDNSEIQKMRGEL